MNVAAYETRHARDALLPTHRHLSLVARALT